MNRIVFIVINYLLCAGFQSSTATPVADFNRSLIIIDSKGDISKQFYKENAIYVIKKKVDLKASTIVVPSGSILLFKGGCFNNGTIIGKDTEIRNKKNKRIFGDNISFEGSWLNNAVYDVWFDGGTFKSIVQNMLSIGSVLHFNRDYTNETINTSILISHSVEMDFHKHTLNVKSRNIANNPGWGCWIFDSEYIKDKNERRNITIRNLRICSTADNNLKNTRFDGYYSGSNLLLCRDLDTVKIDNVRTRDIDYCVRVGGEYGEKLKNVDYVEVTNCDFDRSVMPLFFKNIEKVMVSNTTFNNENQNSSLLHCIYVYEGVDDMLVESCQFENSLSAVNFGTTANPSNPIGTVVFKDCKFNCATNGAGSVGSWYTNFSDYLYFEDCIITNQGYSINGNATFRNCNISGTIQFNYHIIHGAKFESCVFDMKLGVDNQYGIVSGELDRCLFNIDCDRHSIYYLFDSHSKNKGTIIKNSTFNFFNTRGDLFLCGSEKPYSETKIKNVTINYPQNEANIKRYIRLLGRSKIIETKGQISIDGLYLNSSELNNYTDDVNYSNMVKFDCQNIFSNGVKQKGVNFKNANVQNK